MKTRDELIDDLLTLAFAEDVGDGDATTLSTIPATEMGRQQLIVKQEGILAGVEIARKVFEKFDPELKMTVYINDGAHVSPGDVAFVVEGRVRSLLQTERIMLNIMQRMSGVATMTAIYQSRLEGLHTKVLDTRKTTPGMRLLEKEAVKIGGGSNHRIGLFDMILIKDNHVDFAGGITQAVSAAKQWCKDNGKNLQIELEVRNTDEIDQALEAGVDRIMLDNFTPARTREAVERIRLCSPGRNTCRRPPQTLRQRHRNRIIRRHHPRHPPQLRRVRCRLHLRRRPHPFRQRPRHELQSLLTPLI